MYNFTTGVCLLLCIYYDVIVAYLKSKLIEQVVDAKVACSVHKGSSDRLMLSEVVSFVPHFFHELFLFLTSDVWMLCLEVVGWPLISL